MTTSATGVESSQAETGMEESRTCKGSVEEVEVPYVERRDSNSDLSLFFHSVFAPRKRRIQHAVMGL